MRILIPTYRRSHRLRTTEFLPKVADKVTLIVRPDEVRAYELAHPGLDMVPLSRKAKDISSTRKEVGLIARDLGLDWFIMADDDLRILQRDAASLKLTPLADGRKLVSAMGAVLRRSGIHQVALSPRFMNNTVTDNVLYTKPQSQLTAYATDDYNGLEWGKFKYFEDVHRTLQLLTTGRNTAMMYNYAIDIGPMNFDGGMEEFREYEAMKAEALAMEERWPGLVKHCFADDPGFWGEGASQCGLRPHIKMQWRKAYRQ
jgi:hypothetical protein